MQCQGTTKDGKPCGRNANEGGEYCSAHLPETPVFVDEHVTCEHENKHFIQSQPDQSFACCELEKGHEGNHGALIHVVRRDPEGEISDDVWEFQEWSDVAGTPVSEISPKSKGKTRFDVYDEAWETPVNR